jgi:hypothetical protein
LTQQNLQGIRVLPPSPPLAAAAAAAAAAVVVGEGWKEGWKERNRPTATRRHKPITI